LRRYRGREKFAMTHLVAGIGELLWDVLPGGKELGGAPGNFAWHARALGMTGVVVSRVGDDEEGREILDRLDRLGLRRELVGVDASHPTGKSTVSLDEAGVPSFHVHEDVAWDFIPFTPGLARLAGEIDAVNFGTLGQRRPVSRETTRSFLAGMKPGAIRLFDLNLRPPHYTRKVIEESLARATVLKLNDDELVTMACLFGWRGERDELLAHLVDTFGLDLIALTRGQKGSILYTRDGLSVHKGFPVRVADTVGAGDAFAAAVIVGMLRGHGVEAINEHANRVAAYVCSKKGATPGLPDDLAGSV
jgi:fructokinase